MNIVADDEDTSGDDDKGGIWTGRAVRRVNYNGRDGGNAESDDGCGFFVVRGVAITAALCWLAWQLTSGPDIIDDDPHPDGPPPPPIYY